MAGQFAIVTGASSGIGLSLAKELATRGYDLAICSSGQRLQAAAEELRGQGVQVTEIQSDLATPEGVNQFWEQVQSMGRSIMSPASMQALVWWPFCRNRFGCRTEHGGPELRGYGAAGEVRRSTYALPQRGEDSFHGVHSRRDGRAP